jgi:hypothetical protein
MLELVGLNIPTSTFCPFMSDDNAPESKETVTVVFGAE